MGVRRKLAQAACGLMVAGTVLALASCSTHASHPAALPALHAAPVADTTAPDPSRAATPAGAAAFARLFYRRITEAYAQRDPQLLAVLMEPTCRACQRYLDSLTHLRDQHQRITPVVFQIRFAEAPATDGRTARVDVQYDSPAITRWDAAGRVIERQPRVTRFNETLELIRVGQSWRVAEDS